MAKAAQRDIVANGIRVQVTEQGEGPLVLLCHGWPEIAHSWRHQLPGHRQVERCPAWRSRGGSDICPG